MNEKSRKIGFIAHGHVAALVAAQLLISELDNIAVVEAEQLRDENTIVIRPSPRFDMPAVAVVEKNSRPWYKQGKGKYD